LWQAEQTTPVDRQQLVRLLVERIVVTVQGQSEQVKRSITWSGGFVSEHRFARSVRSYEQLTNYAGLCARIDELRGQGQSWAEVAQTLNAEGQVPPRQAERFNGRMVQGLLDRRSKKSGERLREEGLRKGEWYLGSLARELGMAPGTLHH
jgi:hypothetical protein